MRNRQFVFTPKIEYKLVAERSEARRIKTACNFLNGASGRNRTFGLLVISKAFYH